MKGAVVYYSTYGSTKSYAEWIAEDTGFALFDQRTDEVPWDEFDIVLIGSPILKMQPFLKEWIRENWPKLEGKRVVLFTTSGAAPDNPGLQKGFREAFEPDIADKIEYVPLHGRMIFSNLKPMHKLLMRIGKMIEKDPTRKAEMLKDVDGVDRSSVGPLVASLASAG